MAYNSYGYSNHSPYDQESHQTSQQPLSTGNYGYQGQQQNPYSPYYQPAPASYSQQPVGQQQYQQSSTNEPSNYSGYQSRAQQYPHGTTDTTGGYGQSNQYTSMAQGSSSSREEGLKYAQAPGSQSNRLHGDASPLGSLAYPSTLERNAPSVEQNNTSYRSQSGPSPPYPTQANAHMHQQSRSRGEYLTSTRPISPYGAAQTVNGTSPPQAQNRQLSNPSQYRVNYPAHARPAVGNIPRRTSTPQQARTGNPSGSDHNPHSHQHQPSGSVQQRSIQSPPARPSNFSPAQNNTNNIERLPRKVNTVESQQPPVEHNSRQHKTSREDDPIQRSISAVSGNREPIGDQPTTVNPSEVFDQVEYQRRKAAAEAEAEAEAEAAKRVATETSQQAQSCKHSRSDSQSKEQIQAEMEFMIEKMREYKSKDPAGFSEIWERFKKDRPPARVSSQTPQSAKPGTPSAIPVMNAIRSPSSEIGPFPSPVLRENDRAEPEAGKSLPDLGKFPALRRRRRSGKVAPTNQGVSTELAKLSGPSLNSQAGPGNKKEAVQAFHQMPVPMSPAQVAIATPQRPTILQSPPKSAGIPKVPAERGKKALGGTIWPEERKDALAGIAKNTLENNPNNKDKVISFSDIRAMLDRNPSYDRLCQLLSARGFQIERSKFARILLNTGIPSTPKLPQLSTVPATSPKLFSNSLKDRDIRTNDPQKPLDRVFSRIEPHSLSQASEAFTGQASMTTEPSSTQVSSPASHNQGQPPSAAWSKWDEAQVQTPQTLQSGNKAEWQVNRPIGPAQEMVTTFSSQPKSAQRKEKKDTHKVSYPPQDTIAAASQQNGTLVQSAQGMPAVMTKEQSARKRHFSDIVDLTQASDGEDTPSPKRQKLDDTVVTENASSVVQREQAIYSNATTEGEHDDRRNRATTNTETAPSEVRSATPINFDQFKMHQAESNARREALRSEVIAQPLDHKKAKRRSGYNPNTIARDLLISKGEHPTEDPLNYYLMPLTSFKHVNLKTDLSTFRWDLVDPGGPSEINVLNTIETEGHDADDEDENTAPRIGQSPRLGSSLFFGAEGGEPQSKFNSILTRGRGRGRGRPRGRESGRIVSSRHIDGTSVPERKTSVSRKTSLVSRGRGLTRGASNAALGSQPRHVGEPPSSKMDGDLSDKPDENRKHCSSNMLAASVDILEGGSTSQIDQPRNTNTPHSQGTSPFAVMSLSQSSNPFQLLQRKRGRPPGSKNLTIKASGSERSPSVVGEAGVKKRGRPLGSKNKSTGDTPSDKNRSPRSRGRPRKASQVNDAPNDGINVIVSSSSKLASGETLSHVEERLLEEVKKKRRNVANKYPEEHPDTDDYPSFPCSWSGCSARLHNLETLRKHVHKLHVDTSDGAKGESQIYCLWSGCTGDSEEASGRPEFSHVAALRTHMEAHHIKKLAWELGDGPSTHPPG